jgi:hypothetical protein
MMSEQRRQQRKVKLMFDSNDEFVLEDAVPELLNYRAKCVQYGLHGFEVEADEEGVQDLIKRRYHSVSVFMGDELL